VSANGLPLTPTVQKIAEVRIREEENMAFIKLAGVDELPPGTAKQITVNGRKLALFNIKGNFYAIDDTCTHRGAPLSEGDCEGTEVTCPWHGARFDLTTGVPLCPPASQGVMVYKLQIVGNDVQVDVPSV
jgi:nitrite reductase/ring-hydroxylating ferredoxin subunit